VAKAFGRACKAELAPLAASARAEHWSSCVKEYALRHLVFMRSGSESGFAVRDEDVQYLVRAFGKLGPEGRKIAEAAARVGGYRASVDYALAEYGRVERGDAA
jgi:hypothetical protein